MSSDKKIWWDAELNDMYGLLYSFSISFALFSIASRLLYYILIGNDFSMFQLWYLPFHFIVILLIKRYQFKDSDSKAAIAVIVAEIYNIAYIFTNITSQEHFGILHSFSILLLTNLELPMIRSKIVFNLAILKHIYIWFFHPLILARKSISLTMLQFNSLFAIILICNAASIYRKKISFDKYILMKEINSSKERFEIITQAFSDGIIIISEDQKNIEFFNSNILSLLQCNSDNIYPELMKCQYLPNRKVSEFTSSNYLIDDVNHIYNNPAESEITLGITLSNEINLEWKARKIIWENKKAIFLSTRNVNQIIELEKSSSNDRMKTMLLRSVSHDLRTPLNAIIFFTNELLLQASWKNEEKNKLQIISASSRLMLSLVDDLLDFSKIVSDVFSIHKVHCTVRNIIYGACELISLQANKKNLKLDCRIDPLIPNFIYTDPLRLSQILLNLLSNALKFTLRGTIEICCVLSSKNKLKCYVEDTGIGMSEQQRSKLFTEYSTSYIPSINPQGSGLGLWISNFLAKELGSRPIKVVSTLGKGTTFRFSIDIFENPFPPPNCEKFIPIESENTKSIHLEKYLELKHSESYDILIVDDNDFNRIVLGSIFSQNQITFEEACNGDEAVKKVVSYDKRGKMYSAVIMDCDMPVLDGFEATKLIRKFYQDGSIKKLPNIIGYSAYSSDKDRIACSECGMVDQLIKPCSPESIINTVKKYMLC
ncbi:unnamed protein product [Blepharisma stoltei]|uniref:Histidine kinase n=1 Tax=Blepharisma stoltei TaxID=1481888 RepID=A0AAU9IIV7_9CILI|nr:unnamed protein product [Blepharisma stoltei]